MAKTKPSTEPKKIYWVARYGNIVDFESHLNELENDGDTEFGAGRFVIVRYKLHSFSIDSRDGTIVAVYQRGV
jgi:hypothetical protein